MNWDFIVVGAGSAGCALTHELVRAGRSVALLEAGSWDRSPFIKVPAGVLRAIDDHDWGYRSQPDSSRNGASEKWVRGRVLGGSSSINGMIYARGAAEDFNRWSVYCGHRGGWSAEEVLPIFSDLECSDQNDMQRGHAGRLHVTTVRHPHPITKAFVDSACAAGVSFNPDYNGRDQNGVSYLQRSLRRGLRCSAADAFLKPLLGKRNLRLRLNTLVERVEVEAGRAVAVSFMYRGQRHTQTAKHIVLCAGAINSPKLLMLSGIGDARELRRHNINVVLELPAVGRNLREHPLVRVVCRSKIPTYNQTEGLSQKFGVLAKFLKYREGPLTVVYESVAFLKTTPSALVPDVQLLFAPIGSIGRMGGQHQLTPYPGFMICIIKSHPVSSGCVRLTSNDPKDPPLIECRLLAEDADVDTLARGIDAARAIIRKDPIARLIDAEIMPGRLLTEEQALRGYIRDRAEISSHPIGTCRMGSDPDAVVGPDLRVRGIENLSVADASIMPDHVAPNINATCIMIGAKHGRHLATQN